MVAVTLVAVLCALSGPSAAQPAAAVSGHVMPVSASAGYIVTLAPGSSVADVVAHHPGLAAPRRTFSRALRGFASSLTPALVARLRLDPAVDDLEPDRLLSTAAAQGWPAWGLDRIDQPGRRLNATYAYSGRGAGVTAYVVDTGIRRHREFGTRLKRGFSVSGGSGRTDCAGHGTHVAGIVGGRRYGVAKRVRLVPVRVGRCGTFVRRSELLAGLDFIVRHHRSGTPAIANLSLGGEPSRATDTAVSRLLADGVTVVAAAGNDGVNACRVSPSRVSGVITVGAVNRRDRAPNWSNHGRCVDVFAPGVEIRSAAASSRTASQAATGTSMAAPHVSGIAARYLARHPGASPSAVHRFIVGSSRAVVRDSGTNTTRAMLYSPGRVPTRLASANGDVAVPWGFRLGVGARLINRVTGAGMPFRKLTLYRRPVGNTTWSRVTSKATGTYGDATMYRSVERAGEYQVRHAGSATSDAARGPSFSVDVLRTHTTLSISVSDRRVQPGERVVITGVLRRTSDGARVANREVEMHWWVGGTSVPENGTTDDRGVVKFTSRPVSTTHYTLFHPRDSLTEFSESQRLTVAMGAR